MQRARVDRGRSGVGVVAVQNQGAGAVLRQAAAAGDDAAEELVAVRTKHKAAVVGDVAGVIAFAEEAGAGDLKGSSVDGGVPSVGVIGREGQEVAAVFGQAAGAADHAAHGEVASGGVIDSGGGAGEGEFDRLGGGGVVDDVAFELQGDGRVVARRAGDGGECVGTGRGIKCEAADAGKRVARKIIRRITAGRTGVDNIGTIYERG